MALAAACSGGTHPSSLGPSAPAGPADPAAMRALLAKYSPSGGFIEDGAPENHVRYISTGVHEMTHAYASHEGIQLLVDRGLPYGDGAEAILGASDPWLVPYTDTFPAAELDATFPTDARTSRYAVYVSPASADQATQTRGAYGLLDELAAYYQDARTTLDLWAWVRDEAPADGHVVLDYVLQLDELHYAYAELAMYLLHYLAYARTAHPEIHDALLANDGFRGAVVDVVAGYRATIAAADALEPTVLSFARDRGVDLARRDGVLFLDGNPFHADQIDAYRALLAHLASDPYASTLDELGTPSPQPAR
jgi:hypothetical protein